MRSSRLRSLREDLRHLTKCCRTGNEAECISGLEIPVLEIDILCKCSGMYMCTNIKLSSNVHNLPAFCSAVKKQSIAVINSDLD